MTRPSLPAPGRIARLLAAASLLMGALLIPATPALAADGLKVDAHVLMQGHVRAGSWFGVAVNLQNDGPTVTGELRISGGTDSRTRFATPVELATGSRKQYVLYALPPAFGGNMTVELVDGSKVVATSKVAIALHDQTQLVVGLVAENPARLVGQLDLLPNQNGLAPVIVPDDDRRSPRTGPGVGGARPADLAGHGQRLADARPARRHAHVDRRRRTPRDRRRQLARRRAHRVPGRPPPVSAVQPRRRRPQQPGVGARPDPGRRDGGPGLRGRCRAPGGPWRRPATA